MSPAEREWHGDPDERYWFLEVECLDIYWARIFGEMPLNVATS